MNLIVPHHIPLSSILPNAPLEKVALKAASNNTSNAFKNTLTLKKPALLTTQGDRLIQSQVNKLQGDINNKISSVENPLSSSLLPFLLGELEQPRKVENSDNPHESTDTTQPHKIQALNELIGDFDIDKDTDFMDLSRWVMNMNNEMLIDEE